jgi:hypothetical protein
MKFALNTLPETFINMLQSLVSLRRIEKYLAGVEVASVPVLDGTTRALSFTSATISWAQSRSTHSSTDTSLAPSAAPSAASTPRRAFTLLDLNLAFPPGELSLVCGKLGSGKTLLLLSLLGEADVLTGGVEGARSPPDVIARLAAQEGIPREEDWVVQGVCAYVPQAAWLRNASIKGEWYFLFVDNLWRKLISRQIISCLTCPTMRNATNKSLKRVHWSMTSRFSRTAMNLRLASEVLTLVAVRKLEVCTMLPSCYSYYSPAFPQSLLRVQSIPALLYSCSMMSCLL